MGAGLAFKKSKSKKSSNGGASFYRVPKTAKQMERHLKGIANHWRIAILLLVSKEKGASVENIASSLKGNFKTISEHLRRLSGAGLINKNYKGHNVVHSLTPYGERFVKFLTEFQNS
ncbi:MAG: winged helix-turn-helix domain-containing protein [Minisyncoccia bacterium]